MLEKNIYILEEAISSRALGATETCMSYTLTRTFLIALFCTIQTSPFSSFQISLLSLSPFSFSEISSAASKNLSLGCPQILSLYVNIVPLL